jgi:hypothetical protein
MSSLSMTSRYILLSSLNNPYLLLRQPIQRIHYFVNLFIRLLNLLVQRHGLHFLFVKKAQQLKFVLLGKRDFLFLEFLDEIAEFERIEGFKFGRQGFRVKAGVEETEEFS